MVDNAKTTPQLPQKNSVSTTDVIVIVYGFGTNTAQTAITSIQNLLGNTANLQIATSKITISDIRIDPANSTATVIQGGTLFFSNSAGYFATANNHVKRFILSDF